MADYPCQTPKCKLLGKREKVGAVTKSHHSWKKLRVSEIFFSPANGRNLLGHHSEPNEDNGKQPNDYSGTKSSHWWANFEVWRFEALMVFVQKFRSLSETQQGPSLEIQVALGALFSITHAIHPFKLRGSENYKYYKRTPRFFGSKHSIWVLIHPDLQIKIPGTGYCSQQMVIWIISQ